MPVLLGSDRGALPRSLSVGFPGPARRTRRTNLSVPGSPRAVTVGQPVVAAAGFGVHGVGIFRPR